MQVEELLAQAKESFGAKAVFGAPYEKNGVTVIPAARFMGGVGGGEGNAPPAEGADASSATVAKATGSGAGFGVAGKATGAFVIKGEDVKWLPAVDVNRMLLGFQVVLVVLFLVIRSIAKSRSTGVPAH